mgnify:CR=1 FL=1
MQRLQQIYLDNSATTRPTQTVMDAVNRAMRKAWFNPSALYGPALTVEKQVDEVRKNVLHVLGADGHQLVFTACGTEADNLAILGHLKTRRDHGRVLIFSGEHPAVSACTAEIEHMGYHVETIAAGPDGCVDLTKLEAQLSQDVQMLIVMQVNNESGAIQPLKEVVALRDRHCPNAAIHVDGVQGFLRVPLAFSSLRIQSYALSGHKVHALKGIGALVFRKDHRISPIGYGGGQENGYRSGTENTPGILSLGAAVDSYPSDASEAMMERKRQLYDGLKQAVPTLRLNGPALDSPACAPHILNVSLLPVRSQTMLFALEGDGILVSAGSACASHKQKVSPVLSSMGLTTQEADCALRFSLCPQTTQEEIAYTVERVRFQYDFLKNYTRR